MADKKKDILLQKILLKTMLVHSANAYKQSLRTIMGSSIVQQNLQAFGFSTETKELDRFFETLRMEDSKVCYGKNSVLLAVEQNAVDTLLISDHLFRSTTTEVRKEYVKLSEKAERKGLKCIIFSSETSVGNRLKNMTGVACILRYPLPELDEIEEDEVDSEEEDSSDEEAKDDHMAYDVNMQSNSDVMSFDQ